MNNAMKFAIVMFLGVSVTGCSNMCLRDSGQSTALNRTAHTLHESPVDDATVPSFDGAKAGNVMEGYRKADTRAADQRLLRGVTN
jgi:hypothetical protein